MHPTNNGTTRQDWNDRSLCHKLRSSHGSGEHHRDHCPAGAGHTRCRAPLCSSASRRCPTTPDRATISLMLRIRIRKDSKLSGRIRIRSRTEINVSDPDSNLDSNLDPQLNPKPAPKPDLKLRFRIRNTEYHVRYKENRPHILVENGYLFPPPRNLYFFPLKQCDFRATLRRHNSVNYSF